MPPQSLGPTLPGRPSVSAVADALVATLPPANRTAAAPRPAADQLRPGTTLSRAARRLWGRSELIPNGRSFYGGVPRISDRRLAHLARLITPVGSAYVIDLHGAADGFTVDGEGVSPETLAEVIAADPRWVGQSC